MYGIQCSYCVGRECFLYVGHLHLLWVTRGGWGHYPSNNEKTETQRNQRLIQHGTIGPSVLGRGLPNCHSTHELSECNVWVLGLGLTKEAKVLDITSLSLPKLYQHRLGHVTDRRSPLLDRQTLGQVLRTEVGK